MKYLNVVFVACLLVAVPVAAQQPPPQPPKKKLPVKNPPQFPHIIDTGEPASPPAQAEAAPAAAGPTVQQMESLVRAVEALAGEVRSLSQEMRALNLRQQAQLDILRLTRADARVEQYERELKATRERIMLLEAEEQNLLQLIKPDSLLAQTRSVGTLDRNETMRQLKAAHEARLRGVTAEKEMLQQRGAELVMIVEGYRAANIEAEKRIQQAEEMLKQLTEPAERAKPSSDSPERKPSN
jgi:hypothetical protein